MVSPQAQRHTSLCITGASGVRYGVRMLEVLTQAGHRVDLVVSNSASQCLALECDLPGDPKALVKHLKLPDDLVKIHDVKDIASRLASGSSLRNLHAGFIVPCSMGTAARIAMGNSGNLIERHADVLIKEKKPLVFVPREMPLSPLHLENLLKLTQLGCICVPASPGFYHRPQSIDDLVDHVIGKVLDVVNIDHELYQRWKHE